MKESIKRNMLHWIKASLLSLLVHFLFFTILVFELFSFHRLQGFNTSKEIDSYQLNHDIRRNQQVATAFNQFYEQPQDKSFIKLNTSIDKSKSLEEVIASYPQSIKRETISMSNLVSEMKSTTPNLPLTDLEFEQPNLLLNFSQTNERKTEISNKKNELKSSDFDLQIKYAPKLIGNGFLFEATLLAKPHIQYKKIPQHFVFIIDRSKSIAIEDYYAAKEAVIAATKQISEEDLFSISLFDRKLTHFCDEPLHPTSSNLKKAEFFLNEQRHGGLFASTDLYSSLDQIFSCYSTKDQMITAILLSDGETFISKEKQRKTLHQWIQKNNGKISLYCLALGKRKNIALLDILATFNKGALKIVNHPEETKQSLCSIVSSLQSPIARNLSFHAFSCDFDNSLLKVFPKKDYAPNLYEHIEYQISGSCDAMGDFTLFVQGEGADGVFDIQKKVTISMSQLSDEYCLKKSLLLHGAYGAYQQYLETAQERYLLEAKEFLKPLKIPMAFDL